MRASPFAWILLLFIATGSDAALLGRSPLTPDGSDYQAYYDTRLDITWLADANYPLNAGLPLPANGDRMTWPEAQEWLVQLNAAGHLGMTGWRLPVASPVDEMADLFFETLGNQGGFDPAAPCNQPPYPSCLTNTGPFENVLRSDYWTGTLQFNGTFAADFFWGGGYAGNGDVITSRKYVWAVHEGDIAAVPAPAAVWLSLAATGFALPWLKRRRPRD